MKLLVKIIGLIIATILVIYAAVGIADAAFSGHPVGAGIAVLQAIVCGGIAGLIYARIFGEKIADSIASSFFYPGNKCNPPPPEFSPIRAKIANGEYLAAETDMKEFLEKNPRNPDAVELLAHMFMDKTMEYSKAERLLKSYLKKPNRTKEDIKFIMMLTDLYVEHGDPQSALDLLSAELKKNQDLSSRRTIKKRAGGIMAQL